jgi:hypothetical protein
MKPRLFLGSSVESLPVAYAMQEELDFDAEITVWSQGIFELSRSTLASLLSALKNFDAAAFVMAPDDTARIRASEHSIARDNVVFEFGLFLGALGPDRVYFLAPRGDISLHLPTDLLGITSVTYDARRTDGNLRAALGPACNRIRQQIRMLKAKSVELPSGQDSSGDATQLLLAQVTLQIDAFKATIEERRASFTATIRKRVQRLHDNQDMEILVDAEVEELREEIREHMDFLRRIEEQFRNSLKERLGESVAPQPAASKQK